MDEHSASHHSETEGSIDSEACFNDEAGKIEEIPAPKSEPEKESAGPTVEDLAKLKQKLAKSLQNETELLERQVELHTESRDLRIAIEKEETKRQIAKLNAEKAKILVAKEAAR